MCVCEYNCLIHHFITHSTDWVPDKNNMLSKFHLNYWKQIKRKHDKIFLKVVIVIFSVFTCVCVCKTVCVCKIQGKLIGLSSCQMPVILPAGNSMEVENTAEIGLWSHCYFTEEIILKCLWAVSTELPENKANYISSVCPWQDFLHIYYLV